MCQSLGLLSAMKYQKTGGPGIHEIMELPREADDPIRDRETFFRAQIFFYLIGASDGHAKNFSLRLSSQGRFSLTPIYDILSLAPVVHTGRIQRKRYRLAMSIGGHDGCDWITPRDLENEGRSGGLPRGHALELLEAMTTAIGPAIERTVISLEEACIPKSVAEPIARDAVGRAAMVRQRL